MLYSLLGNCRRYGHNPHDYLRDVLTRLPAMTTEDDLRPPLPGQWKNSAAAVGANAAGSTLAAA